MFILISGLIPFIVGIYTGDVQLNRGSSCIVMTTEILQAMLYKDDEYI